MATIETQFSEHDSDVYDEELAFLQAIQSRFLSLHQQTPIEYEDPDVKRLTEAMASFMAKGRIAGKKQIDQLHLRVFHQLLPYLSSPLASMGLLKANTQGLTEPTCIKMHTAFSIETEEGQLAQYRSLCSMPLQPISLNKIGHKQSQTYSPNTDHSIILSLKALNRVPGQLSHLPLFLTYNDNYILSLQLKALLAKRLVSVTAMFDDAIERSGYFVFGECGVLDGSGYRPQTPTQEDSIQLHPIDHLRRFFQLPQQENYLNLYFDETPVQWSQCQIELKLNNNWPKSVKLSSEHFQLCVLGVENLLQEQAAPFTFDATQSTHAIRPPSTSPDLSLAKCLGVYKGAIKKRDIIKPGILKGGNQAYELYHQSESSVLIDIQFVEAFTNPIKITIDAIWHQPNFSHHLWQKLSARTLCLDIPNLHFTVFSTPVPCLQLNSNDPHGLMELSLLKNKDALSLEDIMFLLENLGSVFTREYRSIKPLIKSLKVESGKIYAFALNNHTDQQLPLINTFFLKLEYLITIWLANKKIKVKIQNPVFKENDTPIVESMEEQLFIPQDAMYVHDPKRDSSAMNQDDSLLSVTPETLFFFIESNENSSLDKEYNDA